MYCFLFCISDNFASNFAENHCEILIVIFLTCNNRKNQKNKISKWIIEETLPVLNFNYIDLFEDVIELINTQTHINKIPNFLFEAFSKFSLQ